MTRSPIELFWTAKKKKWEIFENVWSAARTLAGCPLADAHILYIGALGGTLPLMNLSIQSKIVFVFEFVFVFVFEFVFVFVFDTFGNPIQLVLSESEKVGYMDEVGEK